MLVTWAAGNPWVPASLSSFSLNEALLSVDRARDFPTEIWMLGDSGLNCVSVRDASSDLCSGSGRNNADEGRKGKSVLGIPPPPPPSYVRSVLLGKGYSSAPF